MVEIFKTDVEETGEAEMLIGLLLHHIPDSRINFDLEDCDRVLRIEADNFDPDTVIMVINDKGYNCKVLE